MIEDFNAKHLCQFRHAGGCADKANVHIVEKVGIALAGTAPGALMVLLSSQGFSTVGVWLNQNFSMMMVAYFLIGVIWLGAIWVSARSDQLTLAGYATSSAALVSSVAGVGATVMRLLQS
jgi:hypothetical protein